MVVLFALDTLKVSLKNKIMNKMCLCESSVTVRVAIRTGPRELTSHTLEGFVPLTCSDGVSKLTKEPSGAQGFVVIPPVPRLEA